MQTLDPHPTLTLMLSFWAGVGPLVGIIIGHRLTSSWQRQQWLLDARKTEYRELLTALSKVAVQLHHYTVSQGTASQILLDMFVETRKAAWVTFADRIYITPEINRFQAGQRFLNLMRQIREGVKPDATISEQLSILIGEIATAARKSHLPQT